MDPVVPATPPDWLAAVEDNFDKGERIAELAEQRGLPVDEYLEAVVAHSAELLAAGRICVRLPASVVPALVAGGR